MGELLIVIITFLAAQLFFNRSEWIKKLPIWKSFIYSIAAIILSILIVLFFGKVFVPIIMVVTVICGTLITMKFRLYLFRKTTILHEGNK
ncbi:hypothetical protein [Heyndrickxia vini]|uniref:Uncharacterized protein n=1 Tax=Heyndrickxia vini TaxID=1476025 RepID=A0ABX7E342_9BACI|nr:hypothetical protein [Heyndrickxia vini]QQZ10119.1 hypothetical protein I5776_03935 [Heyndrickxia vini]